MVGPLYEFFYNNVVLPGAAGGIFVGGPGFFDGRDSVNAFAAGEVYGLDYKRERKGCSVECCVASRDGSFKIGKVIVSVGCGNCNGPRRRNVETCGQGSVLIFVVEF